MKIDNNIMGNTYLIYVQKILGYFHQKDILFLGKQSHLGFDRDYLLQHHA